MDEEIIEDLINFVIKNAFEGLSNTDPWSVERAIREFFKEIPKDK